MNASLRSYCSYEDREVPFLVGFECFLEYAPPGKRFAEYIDQYLSLNRVCNSKGLMRDARIVTIRISRVHELVEELAGSGAVAKDSRIPFSYLIAMARAKANPRFRHIDIYDVVQEIVATLDLAFEPNEWLPLIGLSASESVMPVAAAIEDVELPVDKPASDRPPAPHRASQSSIPVSTERSSQSSIKAPPPPPVRRNQPSRP